jgi:diguanylate cyclase (GGDEF)-like protein
MTIGSPTLAFFPYWRANALALEALGAGLILARRGRRGPRIRANPEARRLLGLASDRGERLRPFGKLPDSFLREHLALSSLVEAGEGVAELRSGEGPLLRRIEARAFPLGKGGWGTLLVLSDVTASAALLEELSTMASQDALTGLYNRRRFDELGDRDVELARRSRSSLGALMIDIDFFKRVNDGHGHPFGDLALRSIASACKEALRSSDILARYGGEEFAALLPASGPEESLAVAERLRKRVEAIELPCEGGKVSLTISLGVYAGVPGTDEDLLVFLRRADEALYRSKALGRNRASFWKPI